MNEKIVLPFDHLKAHEHLTQADKRLGRLIADIGEFPFKLDECDSVYESLLEAIAHQSISSRAAATIFARIKALGKNGQCPTPAEIIEASPHALREAGLSFAKVAAMKDLAQKTIDGVVPSLEAAHKMSDEELVERLISVRGIGAWTVEMFLIFRLGRPDVLPIHDYGVQKGFAILYHKKAIQNRGNSLPSANAGAPTAPSRAGTCGEPSNAQEKTQEKSQKIQTRRKPRKS